MEVWVTNRVLDGEGVTISSLSPMTDEPVVEETEIARSVVVGVEGIITLGETSIKQLKRKRGREGIVGTLYILNLIKIL